MQIMPLGSVTKGIGIVLVAGITSEVIYRVYIWLQTRKHKTESRSDTGTSDIREVLFFPDSKIACKAFFAEPDGCTNRRCRFSHEENSLSKLYSYLSKAKTSIDVCVFVICCQDLGDVLISAFKRGVSLRVICDDEQVDVTGSQVWRLRSEGINVRTDNSSYFMHHKFVIVDDHLLINGSFNWTHQAITGNQENLIISNDVKTVKLFREEFDKLWTIFDPKLMHQSVLHKFES